MSWITRHGRTAVAIALSLPAGVTQLESFRPVGPNSQSVRPAVTAAQGLQSSDDVDDVRPGQHNRPAVPEGQGPFHNPASPSCDRNTPSVVPPGGGQDGLRGPSNKLRSSIHSDGENKCCIGFLYFSQSLHDRRKGPVSSQHSGTSFHLPPHCILSIHALQVCMGARSNPGPNQEDMRNPATGLADFKVQICCPAPQSFRHSLILCMVIQPVWAPFAISLFCYQAFGHATFKSRGCVEAKF